MQIEQKITLIIEKSLEDLGYELVRVKYFNLGKKNILQIMIDRLDQKPIIVDDCEKASNTISVLLDVEDPIDGEYNLEVSSPGIDRPLTKAKDFARFVGYDITLEIMRPINGQKRFQTKLIEADDEKIKIEQNEQVIEIEIENIETAKLTLTNELIKKHNKY